ncbi:7-cyano-7-deazaguanine synthase [Patescibacteria group bacterium]|nr:7-cyano-7-deazaguanine synthase [Patescibacteria group bacterium]
METAKTKMNEELLKGLQREPTHKAVLLYSGGIDSTAAGLLLKQEGYSIWPLFIKYGQSAQAAEEYLVRTSTEKLGFEPTRTIETDLLKQLTRSRLLGQTSVDDSDAWVPGRNTLFMVLAGIYAKQIDADGISIGYMLDDNFVFGDNDFFHHQAMEGILSRSFLQPTRVLLPTMARGKQDLTKLLYQRGVLDLTVSCWNAKMAEGRVVSCQECANCVERNKYINELREKL